MSSISSRSTPLRHYAPRVLIALLGLIAVLVIGIALNRPAGAAVSVPPNVEPVQAAPAALQATALPAIPTPVAPSVSNASAPATGARVTGNFISANQVNLMFLQPGRIKEIKVKEGDKVKQGDLLAVLDTAILEYQVAQAQAGLKLAQLRVQQTQSPVTKEQQEAAKAALSAAEANFARVSKGPSRDEVAMAKANLDRAKAAVEQTQAIYDRAGGASNPYAGLLPTSLALQQANFGYEAALAQYNLAINHPTAAELAGVVAQLAQAKAAVAQLTPTAENLALAQTGVEQARIALDLAKQALANARLTAPFDGTVIWIGPKVGEMAGATGPVIMLADLTRMQVTANVDEITLADLKVGQPVTLTLDALGGKTLTGKIARIGLLASSAGGVVSVPVTIDVDPTDAAIYPGLSATVEFSGAP